MIIRLIILGIFLFAIYLALKISRSQKQVKIAEAGPFKRATSILTDITYNTLDSIKDENEKPLSLKNYIPYKVKNDCMEFVGLFDGDIVFVKKTRITRKNVQKTIKQFDLVLIEIDNKSKLRMVDKINEDDSLRTFYFDRDRENNGPWFRQYSSRPHKFKDICGVVTHKNCNTVVTKEIA